MIYSRYTMENFINQIIHGDCIEVMQQIPSDSVDVTFADPPFNLKKKYGTYKDEKGTDDYLSWCKQWILEMVRITKPSGSVFLHNPEMAHLLYWFPQRSSRFSSLDCMGRTNGTYG